MSKSMNFLTKNLPFVAIIILNALAHATNFQIESLKTASIIAVAVLLVNTAISIRRKSTTYFMISVTGVMIFGTAVMYLSTFWATLYVSNLIAALYVGLFLAAFVPPLFTLDPFTFEYSKKDYPRVIWSTRQFLLINLIINYIWSGLFLICILLVTQTYSDNAIIQQVCHAVLPIAVLLGIGLPVNLKLPGILQQRMKSDSIVFSSVAEMLKAMPFGLNKKKAEGIDAVIQFELTGEEAINGFLTIKNQTCTYTDGTHDTPTLEIKAPSKVWLDISNGDLDGAEGLLNGLYTVEGDAPLLLKLHDLFSSNHESNSADSQEESDGVKSTQFEYGQFGPAHFQKILVIDGGGRSSKFSKSTMMARKFFDGAVSAGAEGEYITLKELSINPCCGCYTCWTKTPGICRYKDDMPEMLLKLRQADLIIYVSPLFVFSVNSRLKAFIDRSIPNVEPYMLKKDGMTYHPTRHAQTKEKGFLIFSAGGFPEVKGNFDGVSSLFRCLSHHSEKSTLMGEFYLPAAELLSQPVYSDRRQKVEEICCKAGRQIIEEGKVDLSHMEAIANPSIDQNEFQSQADTFWKSMDGKMSYYKGTQHL